MMWSPVTMRRVSAEDLERDRTHFKAYGLGWRLADVRGYKEVSHTGTLAGMSSYVVLIPEIDLGVVVLTNGSSDKARRATVYSIVRPYLGVDGIDWVEQVAGVDKRAAESGAKEQETPEVDHRGGSVLAPLSVFTGRYRDPWFGVISIYLVGEELWFASLKSPLMKGRLWPFRGSTFFARWTDRTLQGDAFVTFGGNDPDAPDRISMRAVSADTDFSFDFEDLDFRRIHGE